MQKSGVISGPLLVHLLKRVNPQCSKQNTMETLVVTVSDRKQAQRITKELGKQEGVVEVEMKTSTTSHRKKQVEVEAITRASEASLAEAWNSPEDDIWDDFYKELCTKKVIWFLLISRSVAVLN